MQSAYVYSAMMNDEYSKYEVCKLLFKIYKHNICSVFILFMCIYKYIYICVFINIFIYIVYIIIF